MIKILNRIMDGMGRRSDIDMLMELEKTKALCPAPRSAASPTAPPGQRARSSTSTTTSFCRPLPGRYGRPPDDRRGPQGPAVPMGSNTR